jgi:hypothetical protein
VNGELGTRWKEVVVTYCKLLSCHTNRTSVRIADIKAKLEPDTSRIESKTGLDFNTSNCIARDFYVILTHLTKQNVYSETLYNRYCG